MRDTSITSRRPPWASRSALSCHTPYHRWRRCCPWRISPRRTMRPNSRWRACRAFPDWCRSTRVSGATSCCGRMRRAGARRSSLGLVARDAGTQHQEPSAPAPRDGGERAQYRVRRPAMDRLGEWLARELWCCFAAKNLRRMVQFAQAFADAEIVASLMRQLSWTHVLQLLPLKTEPARRFYAGQCMAERWSVRELHRQIKRKAFERSGISGAQGISVALHIWPNCRYSNAGCQQQETVQKPAPKISVRRSGSRPNPTFEFGCRSGCFRFQIRHSTYVKLWINPFSIIFIHQPLG